MKTSLHTDSQILGLWYENTMKKRRGQPSIGQKRKINTLAGSNIFFWHKNQSMPCKKEKKKRNEGYQTTKMMQRKNSNHAET